MYCRSLAGMSNQQPLTMRSSSIVRLLHTIQYCLHKSEWCGGKPLIMSRHNCWHSELSLAALHSVSRWGLDGVLIFAALISKIEGSG